MICQATERAVLLWLLRQGSTSDNGLDMNPVTATTLQTYLNTGVLVKPTQTSFKLYAYAGEEEERKKMPSLTVMCANAVSDISAPGNSTVDVEIELKINSASRPDISSDAEFDVIELIESAGRWLEEKTTDMDDNIVSAINVGHEWCTVMLVTQSPTLSRFTEKSVRGARASMQLYASLWNYR